MKRGRSETPSPSWSATFCTPVVQLGVGLHVGTALLQLYGELGVEPLARVLERTRSLFAAPQEERPPKAIEEELERLVFRF